MQRYRKKPVIVQAIKYKKGMEDGFDRVRVKTGKITKYITKPYVNTLEGKQYVTEDYYIVTGVRGERYPVRADIFEETYEKVEDNESDLQNEST